MKSGPSTLRKRAASLQKQKNPASELLEGGAAPSVVQKQMRHSDARVTLERYSHVIGDAQRVAVSSLAARIERHVEIQLESST